MKEMIYKNKRIYPPIILANGKYRGYTYWILNLGTHPTAYVEVPRGHPYWFKDYDEIPIDCHWGLTYSENYLSWCNSGEWTVGWDYAHCDDYSGYYSAEFDMLSDDIKKWSTKEIFKEVKEVIKQLDKVIE